jgi:hypothetical protein
MSKTQNGEQSPPAIAGGFTEVVHSSFKIRQPVTPVEVTRDDMNRLLFETHKKCANSAEEVMTLKEIAKINDLYPKQSESATVTLHHVVHSMDKLQKMDDAQLLKLIGEDALFDMPQIAQDREGVIPCTIEGEYEEIEEGKEE